jgi:V8-like Glu-specific endopeptidase
MANSLWHRDRSMARGIKAVVSSVAVSVALFVIGWSCAVDFAHAQQTDSAPPNGAPGVKDSVANKSPTLSFRRIRSLARAGKITVIHGVSVTPSDWPVLILASFADSKGEQFNCTATVVGPKVVLTAAHCVDAGGMSGEVRPAQLDIDGQPDYMTCRMHPVYAVSAIPKDDYPRSSTDYALCMLDADLSDLPAYRSTQFEDIDTSNTLNVNDPILVTGYGCTSIKWKAGKLVAGDDNADLRVGDARVSQTPSQSGPDADYLQSRSQISNEAALCPGDSGGPLLTGASLHKQTAPRRIAGVNSSLTVSASNMLISRFGALATPEFKTFVDGWLRDNGNPTICGYNVTAGTWPCRN